MAAPARNNSRRKPSGSRVAAFVILFLIAAAIAGYYLLSPTSSIDVNLQKPDLSHVKPGIYPSSIPKVSPVVPPLVFPPLHKEQRDYPPRAVSPEAEQPGSAVRLAIIIDDMGSSLSEARSLAAIKVPLTFAIIPGLRSDKEVAAFATGNAIETMIHVPMQSKGWPARRLEANGLLVSMDTCELQERMSRFIQQFPGAVGVNNHMGSEFTGNEEKMAAVLQVLKKHNLFFIDSVTSPESVGFGVAQRLGIRAARRHVFLDNEQERSYILEQLDQAVRLARKNGSAIAICHPHPATITTLAAALPDLAGQGVQLVPASQLVK